MDAAHLDLTQVEEQRGQDLVGGTHQMPGVFE
jgi:hypothetical protein